MRNPVAVLTRRRLLQFAGGGTLGLNLGGLWRAQAAGRGPSPAGRSIRACILVFYYGGPSHLDTFDLKPNAPAEIRGEFKPIERMETFENRHKKNLECPPFPLSPFPRFEQALARPGQTARRGAG